MTDPAVCPARHQHQPDRPRPSLDGLRLCQGHRDGLADDITAGPKLWAELHHQLNGGDSTSGDKVSGTRNPGLNLNDKVTAARDVLRRRLLFWARYVAYNRGLHPPPTNPRDTGPWLARHVDWLAACVDATEIAEDLRDATDRARPLCVPQGRRFPIGPCTEVTWCDLGTGSEQLCPGQLEAVLRGGSMDREADLRCDTCGDATPHGQWLEKYVPPSQRGRRAG